MSANVESMMYVREVPWHGLGQRVLNAPSSKEALRLAGLDWKVNRMPVYAAGLDGKLEEVPNFWANQRSSDGKVLGVVSGRYQIVDNEDAFAFTDELLGYDIRYETAGSLDGGKRIWLLARMPDIQLVGDKTEVYLVFTNSHDGKGSIRVAITPVRVVCQNTLNAALGGSKRQWAAKHVGEMDRKMDDARDTLQLANTYLGELQTFAEEFAAKPFHRAEFKDMTEQLFQIPAKGTDREKENMKRLQEGQMQFLGRHDLGRFRDTAWGALNAVSDFVTHRDPQRATKTYRENVFASIVDGDKIIDKATEILRVA